MNIVTISANNLIDFSVWYQKAGDATDDSVAPVVHVGVNEWEDHGNMLRAGSIAEIKPRYVGATIRFFIIACRTTPQGKKALSGQMLVE